MQYPKEHYRQLGYEGVGYACPPLSSHEEYPDYIRQEVEIRSNEIFSHQSYNTFSFAFMADIHLADNENHLLRWKRTVNAYKKIADCTGVDRLILGGDLTNEGNKEYKFHCYRLLRQELSGINYYPINGNHDDGTIWDRYYIEKENSWCNHLTKEERYCLLYNHLKAKGAVFDDDGLYYYFDDTANKVRFIFLDSCDVPLNIADDNGRLLFEGQHDYAYSQKQLDWMINKALVFNESGWGIIIVTHIMPFEDEWDSTRRRVRVLHELLSAYKNGDRFSYRNDEKYLEVNINADFSERPRAEVIATLVGHDHSDLTISKDGLIYIETANCVMYKKDPLRIDGTASELLFDVFTVNRSEHKIYITRIGRGDSRTVDY